MSCDFDRLAILRPSTDPPDGEGKFQIEPDALMFSCPHDLAPAHQVLGPQGVVIGQAEFPERNFDIRLLGKAFTNSEKVSPSRSEAPLSSALGSRRSLATLLKARSMTRSSISTVVPRDSASITRSPNQRRRCSTLCTGCGGISIVANRGGGLPAMLSMRSIIAAAYCRNVFVTLVSSARRCEGFVRVTAGRLRMAQHAQTQAAIRPRGRATRPMRQSVSACRLDG